MARRWFPVVPPLLLAGGAGLIVLAILQGSAQVSLVLFIPVFTGTSALFLMGVLLVVAGFALLPFALGFTLEEDDGAPPTRPSYAGGATPPAEAGVAAGGVLLIGPLPILLGGWSQATPGTYLAFALLGLALTLMAIVLFLVV
jgi:uncharacterized membrane protein